MGLKFIVKLVVDQQISKVDAMKAFLAFPIDVAFLSMSFGAAVLAGLGKPGGRTISATGVLVFAVACITVAIITTMFCKRSDRAFDLDKTWPVVGWGFLSYAMSFLAAAGSLQAGSIS